MFTKAQDGTYYTSSKDASIKFNSSVQRDRWVLTCKNMFGTKTTFRFPSKKKAIVFFTQLEEARVC